jgi:peptidoglycan/xylan/chitin deacetylase (PgdA/CDA1 family)
MIHQINKVIARHNAYFKKKHFNKSLDGLRILCYHSVNPSNNSAFNPITNIKISDFILQMEYLRDNEFECIGFEEMEKYLEGRIDILNKSFILTFDDGFKSTFTHVLPVLNTFNYNCIIFVSTGHIGGNKRLDCELYGRANNNNPETDEGILDNLPLTEEEIYKLSCMKNVLIGSHGCSHQPYTGLNDEEIEKENIESKSILENITGKKIYHFAFPNGDYDNRSYILTSMHYRFIYGVNKGLVVKGMSRQKPMNRHSIHSDCDIEEFNNQIFGGYDWIQKRFGNVILK